MSRDSPYAEVLTDSQSVRTDWAENPELATALLDLLERAGFEEQALDDGLSSLVGSYGPQVYAEMILMLMRLRLSIEQAQADWIAVREYRRQLQGRTGARVDFRVALLGYFLDVRPQLQRPAVAEMDWIRHVMDSAHVDELTGLPNYRAFDGHLAREIARANGDGTPLSLIMLDLDDFKRVNDRFGHAAGNAVLASVGKCLATAVTREAFVARFGGEEFVALLPSTTKVDGLKLAERLRGAIEQCAVNLPCGATIQPSASLGIGTFPGDAQGAAELLERADSALYEAKHCGKNIVCGYGQNSRSFSRHGVRWSGELLSTTGQRSVIETRVLGDGGALIATDATLPVGCLVDLVLNPPGADPLRLAARVVRVDEPQRNDLRLALRFLENGTEDHARIRSAITGTVEGGR